jgi:hypothetical protein
MQVEDMEILAEYFQRTSGQRKFASLPSFTDDFNDNAKSGHGYSCGMPVEMLFPQITNPGSDNLRC